MSSRSEWTDIGQNDPLWGVYSHPDARHGGWEGRLDAFFASGERDVAEDLDPLGDRLAHGGHVLDFGCGVGRTTRALERRFSEVTAVDVSPPMIERARTYLGESPNVRFVVNSELTLPFADATFDVVYSRIVLQHMKGHEALGYIREFGRVVKPGGWVVFQVPTSMPLHERVQPRYLAYKTLRALGVASRHLDAFGLAPMRITAIGEHVVHGVLQEAGCDLHEVRTNHAAGRAAIVSRTFSARRRDAPTQREADHGGGRR